MLKKLPDFILILIFFSSAITTLSAQDEQAVEYEITADDTYTYEGEVLIEDSAVDEEELITPGQVSVIDREDIETSGARTVAEAVEQVPGVVIAKQGGVLEPVKISIRGSTDAQVLILIDGKPSASVWSGTSDLGGIRLENVERIEVIRGAGAAMYGDGAFSGVINIITREPEKKHLTAEASYGYGSWNTHLLNALVSGPLFGESGFDASISGGGLYTRGNYEYSSQEGSLVRENNSGWSAGGTGVLNWVEPEEAMISVSADTVFDCTNRGVPGISEFLTPEAEITDRTAGVSVNGTLETESSGAFFFSASLNNLYSNYINPEDDVNNINDNTSIASEISWQTFQEAGSLLLDYNAGLKYSFDYLYSNALSDSTLSAVAGNASQHSGSSWLNLTAEYGSFDLIPAVRYDFDYSIYAGYGDIFNNAFSWSAAAGYSPFRTETAEGPLYFKLNAGTGYNSPSFRDLFWPSGSFASGNPDLEPETSFSWDAGMYLDLDESGLSFEAVFFHSNLENLIQWMPSAGGIWRPRNIGLAENYGIETSASWLYEPVIIPVLLDLTAAYSWLNCVDADDTSVNFGKQLAYRPGHTADISLRLTDEYDDTLEIGGSFISYRYTNNSNTKALDAVFIMSAALNVNIGESLRLSAIADNITNVEYIDRLGYPVPGFEWTIKGKYYYENK